MKRSFCQIGLGILLVLLLMAGNALAQGSHTFAYNIPFSFHVGAVHMPAGPYIIKIPSSTKGLIYLDSQDGIDHAILLTIPFPQGKDQGSSRLIFHQYGKSCFLYKVWDGLGAKGQELMESSAEREFVQRAGIPKTIEVALAGK